MIHDRQRAGQTETYRTGMCVWLGTKFNRRRAKHFRARLELNVHFQSDRGDVGHFKFLTQWQKKSQRNLRRSFNIQMVINYSLNPAL